MLGRPHLVLAHVGGDDGILIIECCLQALHQGLWRDYVWRVVERRLFCARQPSVRDHQLDKSCRAWLCSASTSAASTGAQSPRKATSARTTLWIEAGSISTWITLAWGLKASSLPVTRSSKRAPTQTIRSAWCMARFASRVPCMPSMPRNAGCEAGKAPRPSKVKVQGAPAIAASAWNMAQADAPELIKPPPP